MNKAFKFFVYILACVFVFFLLVKFYTESSSSLNTANVFEWEKVVNVYFSNSHMGSDSQCDNVFPVSRTVPNAETLGPESLEELLLGPSTPERSDGYFTSINNNVLIQKFNINDRVAYVDFSPELNMGVAGSCRVLAIKSQIEKTLIELPDIDSVVISIDGKTDGILEP